MFLVVTLHQLIIMVTSCIAIGCTNHVKAGSGISFHRFPLSRPELLHTVEVADDLNESAYEAMLIQLDHESPNELLDNVLYYIAGFVVRSLLKVLKCGDCRSALLLDADDPHALHKEQYPLHAKLACFKQSGGLIFPSQSVLKIVKTAEVLFNRVLFKDKQIPFEKNLELKIQYGILQQLGPDIFARSSGHFFDHTIGEECDHLSSLLRLVTKKYISLRMKTYGK